ncbi:piggyBac transposable element-derived protein 4-like [Hydra vulgaris]|uniref:PiggyBac transposable element-derived protein 4-like n=1 Tax=Hydra vulgaris TaxID=6087 RepID=A0ABM4DCS3_HYDVU
MTRKRFTTEEVLKALDETSTESDSEYTFSESETEFSEISESEEDIERNEIDDNGPALNIGWTKLVQDTPAFEALPFTVANVGPQHSINLTRELDFFKLFFTDELLADIVTETNRYAKSKIENNNLESHSIWHKWKNVTLEEIHAYFGTILNMALNEKSSIKHYFSCDWLNYMPFFSAVFSRNRFLQIHWMLHVSPPSNPSNELNRRARKVHRVVSEMKSSCSRNFVPSRNIAIDEVLLDSKWGIRVFVLADSETGYISFFEPYYGNCTTESLARPMMQFTSRIVLHLCDELLEAAQGSGYHLFTDRLYTSFPLAQELLKMNIQTTGTIMKNRKQLPEDIKKLKLKRHEVSAYVHSSNVMVLAWQDRRQGLMLSTFHDSTTEVAKQRIKGGIVDIDKPTVIVNYSKYMGAVDRADHYCSSYSFLRKSLKWWRKIFFWLLEVAVVNSYILFNKFCEGNGKNKLRHLTYRQNLIEQLVGACRNTQERKGRRSSLDDNERLNQKPHFIAQVPSNNAKDCLVCSDRKTQGGRKKTVYFCKTCTRKPGLHPTDCFELYHTKTDFRIK